ncbi:hypothetical protein B0T21DRAFT_379210 [Apiosordaria backusii]|uniref:Apple domain-containing protein n=1 Tax=Apiosordaria backusii TaxID=314023 RepID=A0AA40DH41_9PEZI|nr:hypothetical protein B0T21DRAFT_379210 [Apiosordaria backusii]
MEKSTPQTGHDGLIHIPNQPPQTAERNSTNYPEVVHVPESQASVLSGRLSPSQQQENESSNLPEVTTEQPPLHLEKTYPEVATREHQHHHRPPPPQQQSPPPAAAQYFQAHQQQRPSPAPTPAPTHTTYTAGQGTIIAEPRPSGVHSLGDAWSINSADDVERDPQIAYVPGAGGGGGGLRNGHNRHPSGPDRSFSHARRSRFGKRPLVKRSIFWVLVLLVAIIIALAGVLGAVATGRIKTAATTESDPSAQPDNGGGGGGFTLSTHTTASGKTVSLSCPSADGLNYTATVNDQQKVFRRQCGANYAGGDGVLGLVKDDVLSLADCLDRCAREEKCAGAVFIPKANPNPECWLKEFLGVKRDGQDMETGVLWQ